MKRKSIGKTPLGTEQIRRMLPLSCFWKNPSYELLPALPKEVKLNLQLEGKEETRLNNKPILTNDSVWSYPNQKTKEVKGCDGMFQIAT